MRVDRTVRSTLSAALIAMAAIHGGCVPPVADPPEPPVAQPPAQPSSDDSTAGEPGNAVSTAQRYFRLEFYQLAVAQGSISTNEVFWKPFDETFLGFTQHESLFKSGFRVGRAPLTELSELANQLADGERAPDSNVLGAGGKVELELRRGLPSQTLFTYDARAGGFTGRDYFRSDNLFVITFRQMPRRPDRVRVTLAPMIRDRRPQISLVGDNVSWKDYDEVQFELGIDCDLGENECLVVSPSVVSTTNRLVIGRAFMMEERPAQMMEKVIVIIPRVQGTVEELRNRPRQ